MGLGKTDSGHAAKAAPLLLKKKTKYGRVDGWGGGRNDKRGGNGKVGGGKPSSLTSENGQNTF